MVQLPHPTTEWSSLQDVFYRKADVYSLSWGIENLADYNVAAASNGGLLALVRDPTRLVSLGKASLLKPKILVYTAAGQLVESIPWDPSIRIIALGFNALEQLVVVLEEGYVRVYTLLSPCPSSSDRSTPAAIPAAGASSSSSSRPQPVEATSNAYYTQHSLGHEATETGVLEARIWSGGLVALVGARRFIEWRFPGLEHDPDSGSGSSIGDDAPASASPSGFAFASLDDESRPLPTPQLLPPADPAAPLPSGSFASSSHLPTDWAVVPPAVSSTGLTTVLIARDKTLLSLTRSASSSSSSASSACQDMRLSRGPFYAVRPSPNGKLLALLTEDWKLWVVSADFSRSLSEFDIRNSGAYEDAAVVEGGALDTPGGDGRGKGGIGRTGIRSIEWCGNNTVALAFSDEVVMVGPFGDSIRYNYAGPVHLVGEVDGLRVISSDRHEFLQKVPDVSMQVFSPGSSDPAALLFDAAEQFAKKSSKADEAIRAIRSDLAGAVDTCLRAAAYEWDLGWQRKLLRAATFGKSFIDLYDPTPLVELTRTLRVLNAARAYEIGIPISYDQYIASGPTALLSRLTSQNHHLLSLRIANFLHIRPDPILKHWARAKIARSRPPLGGSSAVIAESEERLCNDIVRKFQMATTLSHADPQFGGGVGGSGDVGGLGDGPSARIGAADATTPSANGSGRSGMGVAISFSEVAWTAWKAGRRNLATRLLDHEARAIDQVPLLLDMHEDKLALVKAIESGDTDLIYHVLLRLMAQLSRGDFFRIVQAPISDALAPTSAIEASASGREKSGSIGGGGGGASVLAGTGWHGLQPTRQHLALASNLLEVYAKEVDRDLLKDFYYQDDRRTDSALVALEEAYAIPADSEAHVSDKVFKLKSATKFFQEDKERVLEVKALDKEDVVANNSGGGGVGAGYLGLSLNETLRKCLRSNLHKKAEKLRSEFKVNDRRWWYIKMRALADGNDWDALWNFANSKKSPVGYTPFIQRLVEAGNLSQVPRYMAKCSDKADKAALVSYINRLPNAAVANELQARLDEL
ncbi:related to vacuolar protein sorting 16 [Pseudozyma flocculosa]|uniref:Related to vacuolar protein sorting 16 n=1 Tax=Pseudozyma flocculosa TaxID=84751 RepID=A0A5C3F2X1_9BASI|nr:related to vacuolar protein sorting 16 [Pseudozyma flocculosa]